jgi:regulator of protease activity HflC (stomatin/prohibitin superfamily)
MLQTFVVRVNEKGILMRDGDFRRILPPGRHRFLPFGDRATIFTCAQDSVMPSDAVVDSPSASTVFSSSAGWIKCWMA